MSKLVFQDIKLNKLKLLAGILLFSQITMAQTVSTLGLELGLTFSQFPKREVMDFQNGTNMKININPLIGPLIGISKKWILSKHFNLTTGIQYQMAGRKYHTYEQAYNISSSENLIINKICMPIDLGYGFKIGKIKPSFYIGVRPNIWLSAKRSYGGEFVENLFAKNYGYKPPKKLVCQVTTGFSSPIGQHLQIKINFNYGYNYYVTTSTYHGNHSHFTITQKTSITSSDYIISAIYYFNIHESKNLKSKSE